MRCSTFNMVCKQLEPFYSEIGRPSVDPELMIRILLIGYCYSIRSERRLCDEVRFNLAYRWFCGLGLDAAVPHHSTFLVNRHGRFRESGAFRNRLRRHETQPRLDPPAPPRAHRRER
jgi:transposase